MISEGFTSEWIFKGEPQRTDLDERSEPQQTHFGERSEPVKNFARKLASPNPFERAKQTSAIDYWRWYRLLN